MHELSLAQGMLQAALDRAAQNDAKRITGLNIEISAAADESEAALHFHIQNLMHGTIAEGARMAIARVPARLVCFNCGRESAPRADQAICPHCASARVRPALQDEFRLVSIDVE
jgi:hydrogenase nickel incorporation protein HypA/HybF